MTIEGSVADVTPVVSPDRAEHDILGIMFEAAFVIREPLCDVGIPS